MPDDLIVRHPPERGRSAGQAVTVYSGCCCLMYVHAIGALFGAIVGGGLRRPAEDPGFDPEGQIHLVHGLFDQLPRTQWIFWSSQLMVLVPMFFLAPSIRKDVDPQLKKLLSGTNVSLHWVPYLEVNNKTFQMIFNDFLRNSFDFLYLLPLSLVMAWIVSRVRMHFWPAGMVTYTDRLLLNRTLWGVLSGTLFGALYITLIVVFARDWLPPLFISIPGRL